MNKKIAIIIPFFGNLNCKGYFQRFLDSCEINSQITWFIFTDDKTPYKYPPNIKITYMRFEDLKEIIQKKYDFQIKLHTSYKLCDFKPAYGDIFESYISDYDWWGYADIDLIWGCVDHFISDDLLNSYEQLYSRGHLTLSRNNEKMRMLYRDSGGIELYKKIFSEEKHYAFDELHKEGGFREIVKRLEISLYDRLDFADVAKSNRFGVFSFELAQVQLKKEERGIGASMFVWNSGNIYRIYFIKGKICKKEYLYVHFQRRVLTDKAVSREVYGIVPNMIVSVPAQMTAKEVYLKHCNRSNIRYGFRMINERMLCILNRVYNRMKNR